MADGQWWRWSERTLLEPGGAARQTMEAALRMFDLTSVADTSIHDIKLQAEVSVGTIYHHFGSKEGLAAALYLQALIGYQRELLRLLSSPVARDDEPEGLVRGFIAAHLRWVTEEPVRARLLDRRRETVLLPVAGRRIAEVDRRLFAAIDRWRRPRVEAGQLRALEQPLLHAVWMGPAHEYTRIVLDQRRDPSETELAEAERALGDAAWAALRPVRGTGGSGPCRGG